MLQAIASSMPNVTGPQAVLRAVSAAAASEGPEAVAQFSLPLNRTQTWHSTPWDLTVDQARKAIKPRITTIVMIRLRVADIGACGWTGDQESRTQSAIHWRYVGAAAVMGTARISGTW